MNPLIKNKFVYLLANGQLGTVDQHDAGVLVRGLSALEYFDYQEYLADHPEPDYSKVDKTDLRALRRFAVQAERCIYALNLRMVALAHSEPGKNTDEIERDLMTRYPQAAHIAHLAMAVAECSGLRQAQTPDDDNAEVKPPEPDSEKNG